MSTSELRTAFDALRNEAIRLAGDLPDLTQRAATYHHLYQHSGGNHAFPLIAAHGALWARGYFQRCLQLGRILAWQYGLDAARRRTQLGKLDDFANQFRDINRRVCIDTYTNYYFTARFGNHPLASQFVPARVLAALNRVHVARTVGREMTVAEKRSVFEAHFLHEQDTVVGPTIQLAVAQFDWPLVKFLALKPLLRFAFFPAGRFLWFRDFSQRDQRVEHGLTAFEMANQVGWQNVEASLNRYRLLPAPFFANSTEYFLTLRQTVMSEA